MSCSERNSCKFSLFSSRDRTLPQLLGSGTEPSSIILLIGRCPCLRRFRVVDLIDFEKYLSETMSTL